MDKLLRIKTSGRDDSRADQYRYPYEPTPYSVLEQMANSGYIGKKNTLVDYGCGKGRVEFFLSYQTRCKTVGIEYDERIYASAVENQKTAVSGNRTEFILGKAEDYVIPGNVDRFYFFNGTKYSKEDSIEYYLELIRWACAYDVERYPEKCTADLLTFEWFNEQKTRLEVVSEKETQSTVVYVEDTETHERVEINGWGIIT